MALLVLHMILVLRGLTSNGRNFYQLRIYLESFARGYAEQRCWALICLN